MQGALAGVQCALAGVQCALAGVQCALAAVQGALAAVRMPVLPGPERSARRGGAEVGVVVRRERMGDTGGGLVDRGTLRVGQLRGRRLSMTICYLCGEPIAVEDMSRDHLPPAQFFPKAVRRSQNLDGLITIPAHKRCNTAYRSDEEYFLWSVGPLTGEGPIGDALVTDLARRYRKQSFQGLAIKTFEEYEMSPGGPRPPEGMTVKRADASRLKRVAWKMVRGLFWLKEGAILPERTPHQVRMVGPYGPVDEHSARLWDLLKTQPREGTYDQVFDDRYHRHPGSPRIHLWGMLFWARVTVFLYHHDPTCRCEACISASAA